MAIPSALLSESYSSSSTALQESQSGPEDHFTIVAFGDSTTAPRPGVVTYSDLLQLHFDQKKFNIRVLNAGIPGHSTAHAAKRFEKDVVSSNPQIVIIQFGINDAAVDVWKKPPARMSRVTLLRYQQNLRLFVRRLKSCSEVVFVMTPNPLCWTEEMIQRYGRFPYDTEKEDGFNVVLKDYASAVRRLALEEEVVLIDVYSAFQHYGKTPGQLTKDLLLDGMHPNSRGHSVIANLLLAKLEKYEISK